MPIVPATTVTGQELIPTLGSHRLSEKFMCSMYPNQTVGSLYAVAAGTILGESLASPGTFYPYSTSPTTAPTLTPSATAGNFTTGTWYVGYTYVYSYPNAGNGGTTIESQISPLGSVSLTSGQSISVGSIALPTGTAVVGINLYCSNTPSGSVMYFCVSTTGSAGTLTAIPTSSITPPPAGVNYPKMILINTIQVDSIGNIYYWYAPYQNSYSSTNLAIVPVTNAPAYITGTFRIQDLVNIDAGVLATTGWRLVQGNLASGVGVIRIG